uniref:Uncharacterized protein n=1 Tax=viral metagenome TaxID=1070528 RepID=A0A6C0KBU2_9ZZZZ
MVAARKCPPQASRNFDVGQRKRGADGAMWQCRSTSSGTRWMRAAPTKSKPRKLVGAGKPTKMLGPRGSAAARLPTEVSTKVFVQLIVSRVRAGKCREVFKQVLSTGREWRQLAHRPSVWLQAAKVLGRMASDSPKNPLFAYKPFTRYNEKREIESEATEQNPYVRLIHQSLANSTNWKESLRIFANMCAARSDILKIQRNDGSYDWDKDLGLFERDYDVIHCAVAIDENAVVTMGDNGQLLSSRDEQWTDDPLIRDAAVSAFPANKVHFEWLSDVPL